MSVSVLLDPERISSNNLSSLKNIRIRYLNIIQHTNSSVKPLSIIFVGAVVVIVIVITGFHADSSHLSTQRAEEKHDRL